jgi:hypothetical protein
MDIVGRRYCRLPFHQPTEINDKMMKSNFRKLEIEVAKMNAEKQLVENLIALDRYPVNALTSKAGKAFVNRCRDQLAANGCCNLNGFLRPEAVSSLVAESNAWEAVAYQKSIYRNPYHGVDDPSLPPHHPERQFNLYKASQLAYDQIPAASLLDQLYRWDGLTRFIATVLDRKNLYRMADPFQAVNIVWQNPGENSSAHFDHSDFTITLLLQAPESGGDFEFVPNIRSQNNECYEEVQRVLEGDRSRVCTLAREPGTLTFFFGRNSLHWVTSVDRGKRATAIFCYTEKPDVIENDQVNLQVYGPRIEPLLGHIQPRY